jgi:hypothetical protein
MRPPLRLATYVDNLDGSCLLGRTFPWSNLSGCLPSSQLYNLVSLMTFHGITGRPIEVGWLECETLFANLWKPRL